MARQLDIDGPRLLAIADAVGLGDVTKLARAFATQRDGRAPTKGQLENARRQVQKWIDGDNGIGWRNAGHLAAVLNLEAPDPFLVQVEAPKPASDPVAMMEEALENQRQMQADLERLAGDVAGLATDVRSALEALESRASTAESSTRQEQAFGDG